MNDTTTECPPPRPMLRVASGLAGLLGAFRVVVGVRLGVSLGSPLVGAATALRERRGNALEQAFTGVALALFGIALAAVLVEMSAGVGYLRAVPMLWRGQRNMWSVLAMPMAFGVSIPLALLAHRPAAAMAAQLCKLPETVLCYGLAVVVALDLGIVALILASRVRPCPPNTTLET